MLLYASYGCYTLPVQFMFHVEVFTSIISRVKFVHVKTV